MTSKRLTNPSVSGPNEPKKVALALLSSVEKVVCWKLTYKRSQHSCGAMGGPEMATASVVWMPSGSAKRVAKTIDGLTKR